MIAIQQTDLESLAAFLRREHLTDDPAWRPAELDGPLVCLWKGSRIVGAGRLYRAELHPTRWRLALHVAPDERRRGIGSVLLDAVVAALPDTDIRDVQAAASASDSAALGFLTRNGFTLLMTTRVGQLDPAAVPDRWLHRSHDDRDTLRQADIALQTLAEVPDRFRETALLHERIYRDQHGWNPPALITPDRCVALFLDPRELDPARQWLAIADGIAIGVASLRRTDDPACVDLGWFGVVEEMSHRVALCRALLGACLSSIRGQGITVSVEIDATDPQTDALVEELPMTWDDAWLTWHRPRAFGWDAAPAPILGPCSWRHMPDR